MMMQGLNRTIITWKTLTVESETCNHQPVYFGVVNLNIDVRTIGSVDVWRCGVCKKIFCEEKQLGIEAITEIVGMPPIYENENLIAQRFLDIVDHMGTMSKTDKDYITDSKVNEIIEKNLFVSVKFLSREEAMKLPKISKLAKGISDSLEIIRIVSIGDFDIQADGGTHVHSTSEIGKVEFIRCDNKGKNNRRIYYKLS
ncbi:hypothetical protein LCGC14_2544280, partial [marine sediment metagenome]